MSNIIKRIFLIEPGPSTSFDNESTKQSQDVDHENVSISKVCRICATVASYVVPIFEGEGLEQSLAEKINKHLPIKVSISDNLPIVLCCECTSTLLAWHELVQCSLHADSVLRARLDMLNNSGQEQPTLINPQNVTNGTDEKSERWSEVSAESEDEPLAALAAGKARAPFDGLYAALLAFRRHLDDHDSSDESEGPRRVEDYDDLTPNNMRKDRLDDDIRAELEAARRRGSVGGAGGRAAYACAQCGRTLGSAHTYLSHRHIHTGERPCVCHVCGKQFRAAAGLRRHLAETHERRARPACRRCGATFANNANLRQHQRVHTGERPFECPRCGRRFRQRGSLNLHLRTHVEHFPFVCAECGAKFRLRAGLARHRLRHTGERPHACALCARAFRERHELTAHALLHTDVRPHACAACGVAFRTRRALRAHERRHHVPTESLKLGMV